MRAFGPAVLFVFGVLASAARASPPAPPARESVDEPRGKAVQTVTGTARMDVKTGLLWVWIRPGSFVFGCEDEKPGRDENRLNAKSVKSVVDGFWMTRGRVTVAEYAACVDAGACPKRGDGQWCGAGPSYPATCISFPEAQSFCRWVGGELPSDRQWEYAADSGYDMNWEFGIGFNGSANGAIEWVVGTPDAVEAGYERTRGGVADLEPLFRCDNGNAKRGHRSQSIGFRCVQAVERRP